jgi:hypothetical protein
MKHQGMFHVGTDLMRGYALNSIQFLRNTPLSSVSFVQTRLATCRAAWGNTLVIGVSHVKEDKVLDLR